MPDEPQQPTGANQPMQPTPAEPNVPAEPQQPQTSSPQVKGIPINRSYTTDTKSTEITTSKFPYEALEKYVNQLHYVYERWYERSKQRVGIIWHLLLLISYVVGFAASLIAALEPKWKAALIVLPLVGSFATSMIVQFRLYEVTQAREQGRIGFQTLSEEGRQLLAAAVTEEECAAIHADLSKKATEIENLQQSAFFGFFKPSPKPNENV